MLKKSTAEDFTVDVKLLRKQIYDLLDSNIEEDSKAGLHTLLGEIGDDVDLYGYCIIKRHKKSRKKKRRITYATDH